MDHLLIWLQCVKTKGEGGAYKRGGLDTFLSQRREAYLRGRSGLIEDLQKLKF